MMNSRRIDPSSQSGNQTLRPITIKQLSEATQPHPEADFQLHGQDVHQVRWCLLSALALNVHLKVTFVGRVFNVAEQSTNVVYTVEDGTGSIDCRLWLEAKDSDHQTQKRSTVRYGHRIPCREGTYVRVVGSLRSFNNKRNLQAFCVRPITDHNEITYHGLDAIYAYLSATKPNKGMATVREVRVNPRGDLFRCRRLLTDLMEQRR